MVSAATSVGTEGTIAPVRYGVVAPNARAQTKRSELTLVERIMLAFVDETEPVTKRAAICVRVRRSAL